MQLQVTTKTVYGTELVYPSDNFTQAITRMTGRKTLSSNDIAILKGVGYTFTVKAQEL